MRRDEIFKLVERFRDGRLPLPCPGSPEGLLASITKMCQAFSDPQPQLEATAVEALAAIYVMLIAGGLESLPLTLADVEQRHVERVMLVCEGNKARAARVLGITRRSLYRRLARLK